MPHRGLRFPSAGLRRQPVSPQRTPRPSRLRRRARHQLHGVERFSSPRSRAAAARRGNGVRRCRNTEPVRHASHQRARADDARSGRTARRSGHSPARVGSTRRSRALTVDATHARSTRRRLRAGIFDRAAMSISEFQAALPTIEAGLAEALGPSELSAIMRRVHDVVRLRAERPAVAPRR